MKPLPFFAILLSAIALAVAVQKDAPEPTSAQTDTADLQVQLHQLQQRLEDLQASHNRLLKESTRPRKTPPRTTPPVVNAVAEPTAAPPVTPTELAELARTIDPLGVIEATERQIDEAYATLVDESRQPWDRAKQAETLKRYGQFDEAALDAMRRLFSTAEDPSHKAAALVALRGYVTTDMRDDILAALAAEVAGGYQHGRLRYHGIEALEPLVSDPVVEDWLTYLAENDPVPRIANRAATATGLEINWESGSKNTPGR